MNKKAIRKRSRIGSLTLGPRGRLTPGATPRRSADRWPLRIYHRRHQIGGTRPRRPPGGRGDDAI